MNHLYDVIRARMPQSDRPFAYLADGRQYTYGDVQDVSGRFANVLMGLGVGPGERVAVQVEKSVEALMLYLACVRAGAVFLPLNTAYTPPEVAYFLGDAEPRLFICDPARKEALAPVAGVARARVETLGVWSSPDRSAGTLADASLAAPTEFDNSLCGPDNLAAILYTSGTTGRSKGAMLSHANLASNAAALADIWRFTADDVLIHALPIFHTHGLFVATNVVLMAGASMLFLPRFDPDAIFAVLPRAATMMGVPTFYVRLLQDERLTREAVAHMRLFVSGSAPLLADTHREWQARTGHAILERYGMTETNMNTSNPYDGERVAGTVGFPLPGVDLRVADPASGATLGPEEIGVIEVKGPNVFKGYWRNPERTREEFRADGFFITGDLGKVDGRGYVHIVGRGKDLIITGGYNVYPKEVETEIDAVPGVIESAVVGVPHPDFGEAVVAVIVTDGRVSEDTVMGALGDRLARFKQPKRVVVVPDLPRNAMGKVQKNVLREEYGGLFGTASGESRTRSPMSSPAGADAVSAGEGDPAR